MAFIGVAGATSLMLGRIEMRYHYQPVSYAAISRRCYMIWRLPQVTPARFLAAAMTCSSRRQMHEQPLSRYFLVMRSPPRHDDIHDDVSPGILASLFYFMMRVVMMSPYARCLSAIASADMRASHTTGPRLQRRNTSAATELFTTISYIHRRRRFYLANRHAARHDRSFLRASTSLL